MRKSSADAEEKLDQWVVFQLEVPSQQYRTHGPTRTKSRCKETNEQLCNRITTNECIILRDVNEGTIPSDAGINAAKAQQFITGISHILNVETVHIIEIGSYFL